MFKLLRHLITIAFLIAILVPTAKAQDTTDKLSLAREMANMTLTMIADPSKKQSDRMESLKRGFANVVDTNWIAKFVIGNTWRKASEQQRTRYSELYKEFLMQTYVATYAQSDTQKVTDIKVLDVKDEANDNFTTRTEVKLSNAKKIKVDYLVKPDGDGYKIIDVIIEGISLLSTHRSEFAQEASRGGMDGIIQKLEQLTAQNI